MITDALPGQGWLAVHGYVPRNNPLLNSPTSMGQYSRPTANLSACHARTQRYGFRSLVWDAATGLCNLTKTEPSVGNPLEPCPAEQAACVFSWRLPGSCGASPSPGIRWMGIVWRGWSPVVGLEDPAGGWSMSSDVIPAVMQGQVRHWSAPRPALTTAVHVEATWRPTTLIAVARSRRAGDSERGRVQLPLLRGPGLCGLHLAGGQPDLLAL